MKKVIQIVMTALFLISVSASIAIAQATEFTYQGRLLEGSLPPTANYDFEFRLFGVEAAGPAIGTIQRPGVIVTSGSFAVKLNFGASFDGTPRWLEIAIRPAGGSAFTTLAPRQSISSVPYAIRSLASSSADTSTNSLQLGGVPANQYVITTDTRLSDDRNPLPNSPNYINNTTSPQASASFNVSGSGTLGGVLSANAITSATQFNIGVNRALALGTGSVFAGRLAGTSNTTGSGNSFFGDSAGRFNITTSNNSFFGRDAGILNTANDNSFFGAFAGDSNSAGTRNSFFGRTAGATNQTGNDNTFVGYNAGSGNTTGSSNTIIGHNAGAGNTTGSSNTIIGSGANIAFPGMSFATAIGAGSVVSASNTITIGRFDDDVRIPGDAYVERVLEVEGSVLVDGALFVGGNARVQGTLEINTLVTQGYPFSEICITDPVFPSLDYRLAFCSSSLRYTDNVETYRPGLEIVRRLRPITFKWKEGGKRDVGFAAEDVADIEPLFAVRGPTGQLEGVKYKQLTTVLVNAVNEQQQIIETQQKRIDALTRLVCAAQPDAELCREKGARP